MLCKNWLIARTMLRRRCWKRVQISNKSLRSLSCRCMGPRIYRGGARSTVEWRSTAGKRRFSIDVAGAGERSDPGGGWVLYSASRRDYRCASADNRRGETEDRGSNQERPDARVDRDQRRRDRSSVA